MARALLVAAASMLLLHSALAVVSKADMQCIYKLVSDVPSPSSPTTYLAFSAYLYTKFSLLCVNHITAAMQVIPNTFSSPRLDQKDKKGNQLIQWDR